MATRENAGRSALKVGFVTARSATLSGDAIWVDAGVGRIVDELRRRVARVIVAMSVSPQRHALHDHRLGLDSRDFYPLPWLPSLVGGAGKGAACAEVIGQLERQTDVTVIQLPFAAPTALLSPRAPRVYHLCADIRALVAATVAYDGWKRAPASLAAVAIEGLYKHLIGRGDAFVLANGEDLLRTYGSTARRGEAVVSATMLDHEILSVGRSRPPPPPFRLLFVGYMRREKGFHVLIEACRDVMERNPGALELEVVGASEVDDRGATADIRAGLAELRRFGTVHFAGHQPFGPGLFQRFADADALALPSLSEGTPRVLVEARAFGCPVVATRVGGIPTSVRDGHDGLLVEPNDSAGLVSALLTLMRDEPMRQRLIRAGIETARKSTVERFVDTMMTLVREAASLKV